jgi:acetyl-CoA acyltransferase
MTDAFICDAVRTPIGRYGGALATVRPDDLAALPLAALLARNPSLDAAAIDEVLLGCVRFRCPAQLSTACAVRASTR